MIYSAKKLLGKRIHAIDDEFGTCRDFLFDDQSFRIRYLVVDTGNWLPGRHVLVSPESIESLEKCDLDAGIPVCMSKQRIERSPSIDNDKPVSRQAEARLHDYWGWQPYWLNDTGAPLYAGVPPISHAQAREFSDLPQTSPESVEAGDPNLRSLKEVCGYSVRPVDADDSGPLHDLFINSTDWTVEYAVVNTRPWFIGAHKVISVNTIKYIDYATSEVGTTLTSEQIKNSRDEPSAKLPIPFVEERELSQV